MLVVEPSPKSHKRLVTVPVEMSVNWTPKGAEPLVGTPTKLALGATSVALI